jgi:hypothetical protein
VTLPRPHGLDVIQALIGPGNWGTDGGGRAVRPRRRDDQRDRADLRVIEGSVRRWHRAWRDGGPEALRSKRPVSQEKLSPQQWARLELELRKGPLAHGFAAGDAEAVAYLVNGQRRPWPE